MQTGGAECDHNKVDAEAMLTFVLDLLVQHIDRCGTREELRRRLTELAQRESGVCQSEIDDGLVRRTHSRVAELKSQLDIATKNLLTEPDEKLREHMRGHYEMLKGELEAAECELRKLEEDTQDKDRSPEQEVELAMSLPEKIGRVATDDEARADIQPLLKQMGLNVGLRFDEAVKGKKRNVRRLVGGVVTFGDRLLHQAYSRGEDHHGRKEPNDGQDQELPRVAASQAGNNRREGISFTKVNRGDRI